MVERLLKTGKIDVNRKNETGRTALHYSCSKGNEEIVSLLLEHNAKVMQRITMEERHFIE